MTHEINTKENCYVYVQGNEKHIEKYYELVRLAKDDKMILWPESGMRYIDLVSYRPYVKSVITENPWVIAMYSVSNVWILDRDGEWVHPRQQTYAASAYSIENSILHQDCSIPLMSLGGLEEVKKYQDKIKNWAI